jgi:hypothetical protein
MIDMPYKSTRDYWKPTLGAPVSGYVSRTPLSKSQIYHVQYRTRFNSGIPWISGMLNIYEKDLPKYVNDRDLNGAFGDYIRRKLSTQYAAQNIKIPQYDIVLRVLGGVGDYTGGSGVPLDPEASYDFMNK